MRRLSGTAARAGKPMTCVSTGTRNSPPPKPMRPASPPIGTARTLRIPAGDRVWHEGLPTKREQPRRPRVLGKATAIHRVGCSALLGQGAGSFPPRSPGHKRRWVSGEALKTRSDSAHRAAPASISPRAVATTSSYYEALLRLYAVGILYDFLMVFSIGSTNDLLGTAIAKVRSPNSRPSSLCELAPQAFVAPMRR